MFVKRSYNQFLKFFNELYIVYKSKHIIGKYSNIPIKDNQVNILEYHPERLYNHLGTTQCFNLGDSLGEVIVGYLLNLKGIDIQKKIESTRYFYCVGSNILASYQDATIWGSGLFPLQSRIEKFMQKIARRKLDIRAVRGPLTRNFLVNQGYKCPEVYGDPAILMPIIYPCFFEKKIHNRVVVAQFYGEDGFRKSHPNEHIVSMLTNDYKRVIDEISSSEIVYTSSLHGIILAESYGIPAVFFRGLPQSVDFKYLDYYYSTGRTNIKIAESFEEALTMDPLPLPDLSGLRKGLLESFPYDLWEN